MPTMREVMDAVDTHPSMAAAARALGVPDSTLRSIMRRNPKSRHPDSVVDASRDFVVKRESTQYDADGEIKSQSITKGPAPGEVFEKIANHSVKGESVLLDPDNRVLARWVKTSREEAHTVGLVEALQVAFERFTGTAPLTEAPADVKADIHTIYPIADLHLGMYSWGKETGEAYDLDIAITRAREAYRSLVQVAPQSRTATLLNLGDFFHCNDHKNATPASGHLLEVDGRHPKVMEAGAELLLELIDLLLQKHQIVEVVCLPGNHDPDSAVAMRVAMRLYFKNNPRVLVDNTPGVTWYKRFGKNLIGATHGHTVKQGDVAGMMACDRAADWGVTEYRVCYTAHIHHERALEKHGVRTESFQTLASRDAYASNGGWRSGHSVQAITLHHDFGEVSRSRVNVLAHATPKGNV